MTKTALFFVILLFSKSLFSMNFNPEDIKKCIGTGCKLAMQQGSKILENPHTILIVEKQVHSNSLLSTVAQNLITSGAKWAISFCAIGVIGLYLRKISPIASRAEHKNMKRQIKDQQEMEIRTSENLLTNFIDQKHEGFKIKLDDLEQDWKFLYGDVLAAYDDFIMLQNERSNQNKDIQSIISDNSEAASKVSGLINRTSKQNEENNKYVRCLSNISDSQEEKLEILGGKVNGLFSDLMTNFSNHVIATNNTKEDNLKLTFQAKNLADQLHKHTISSLELDSKIEDLIAQARNLKARSIYDTQALEILEQKIGELKFYYGVNDPYQNQGQGLQVLYS